MAPGRAIFEKRTGPTFQKGPAPHVRSGLSAYIISDYSLPRAGVVQLKQDMATVGPMRAFSKRIDSSRILTAPQHSGSLRSVPTFGGSLRSVPTFDSLASQTIPEYDVELAGSSPKSPVYSNGSYSYRGQGSSGLYNLAVIERDQQAELTSARQSAVTSANDSSSGSAFYPSIPRMPSARDADDGDVHVGDGQPPSDMTVRVHSP